MLQTLMNYEMMIKYIDWLKMSHDSEKSITKISQLSMNGQALHSWTYICEREN